MKSLKKIVLKTFLLILFYCNFSNIYAQCTSLTGDLVSNGVVAGDSIFICSGDSLHIVNTYIDTAGGAVSQNWQVTNKGTTFSKNLDDIFSPGLDTITFTVSTSGCSIVRELYVFTTAVNVNLWVNDSSQCLNGNSFIFRDSSTYQPTNTPIDSMRWSVNGLIISDLSEITHSFIKDSTKLIIFKTWSKGGCFAQDSMSVNVLSSPSLDFEYLTDTIFCYQPGINDTVKIVKNSNLLSSTGAILTSSLWKINLNNFPQDTFEYIFNPSTGGLFGDINFNAEVVASNGCKIQKTASVHVVEPFQSVLSFSDTIVCEGDPITAFFNTNFDVKDGLYSREFKISAPLTYSLSSDSFIFYPPDTGEFTVSVVEISDGLCKDTAEQILRSNASPIALITSDKFINCEGESDTLSYQSLVSDTVYDYSWSIGTDSVGSSTNLDLVFDTIGLNYLTLGIYNSNGCNSFDSVIVGVSASPSTKIVRTNNDSCVSGNQGFKIINNNNGAINNTHWYFHDSTDVVDSLVFKRYLSSGQFQIEAISTDEYGCKDTTSTQITVPNPPNAKFTVSSYQACYGNQAFTYFDSSSTSVGQIIQKDWYFSDGYNLINDTIGTFSKNFVNPGSYTVTQVVQNDQGCFDTTNDIINVYPNPTADFNVNDDKQCLTNNNFVFTNTSVSNFSNNTLLNYWNFGDSTSSNDKSPQKTYSRPGQYQVSLQVTSAYGCTDSFVATVSVLDIPSMNLSINNNIQCENDNLFELRDSSTFNGSIDSIFKSEWYVNQTTTIAKNTDVTFTSAGSYPLVLKSYSKNGCYDSINETLVVRPKPISRFSIAKDTQCLVGNVFDFTNNSSVVSGGGNLNFLWNFGDSSESNLTSPSKTYSAYGTYDIKLITTSNYGCIDEITKQVFVIANPSVTFSSDGGNAQCKSSNGFNFSNTTDSLNGSGLEYNWDFGDGSKSVEKTPSKSFAAAGVYITKLKSTNRFGCKDSSSLSLTVYNEPNVNFSLNSSEQCEKNQSFNILNSSTVSYGGGTLSYNWLLDDSIISSNTNISLNSLGIGNHQLKLIATNNFSCTDSTQKAIRILGSPKADFTINQDSQCLDGNRFQFYNGSLIGSGTLSYTWNFGDSLSSQMTNPVTSFDNFGSYEVALIAYTSAGCSDTVKKLIFVHSTPVIEFTLSDTALCLRNNEFIFNNNSSNPDGLSLSYSWDLGDSTRVKTLNTSRQYSKSGDYFVRLIGESSFGCKDSTIEKITIFEQPFSSFLTVNSNQCFTDNEFEFINTSKIKGNGILKSNWDFGDGRFDTASNPKLSYMIPGIFDVTLAVESTEGCKDTSISKVNIYEEPTVKFSVIKSDTCFEKNLIKFTNNSSTNNQSTFTYKWSFGDDNESIGDNPIHRYSSFDTFEIQLKGITSFGCVDSFFQEVIIYPNPYADFSVNSLDQCENGNTFEISNNSSSPHGQLFSNWFFGDSTLLNVNNPTFTFDSVGTYKIKLNVLNEYGCADTLQKIATVLPSPISNFNINDTIQCINGNKFVFFNNSVVSTGNLSYVWQYGDGTINKLYNGDHTYSSDGFFVVKLIAITDNGCRDTLENSVVVTPKPDVLFDLNDYNQCLKGNLFSTNNNSTYSGPDTLQYYWDLGDGNQRVGKDIQHDYKDYGIYDIQLTIESETGCKDSLVKQVEIFSQGISEVNLIKDSVCLYNNIVRIGNNSRIIGDRFTSLEWIFGDGLNFVTQSSNPIDHSYNDTGEYVIQLITTTNNLCKDTSAATVYILRNPKADITSNTTTACYNEQQFEFTDISTFDVLNSSRKWYLENKFVGNDSQFSYEFREPGIQEVVLVESNSVGCTDTARLEVLVNESPIANFRINNRVQCLLDNNFEFYNISTGNGIIKEGLWLPESGSAAFEEDLIYNYLSEGNYDVTLTVYNDSGCSDEITRTVIVHPTPEANLNSYDICTLEPVTFNPNASISYGKINTYDWNMGEGTFLNDTAPQFEYKIPGEYTVKLKLISDKLCENDFETSFTVYGRPVANFSNYTERATILSPKVLLVDSSYDSWYWEWDFGDGSPFGIFYYEEHTYEDTGNFDVRLVAFSDFGCSDTIIKTVRVWPEYRLLFPTAFSPNNDGINDKYHVKGFHHSLKNIDLKIYDSRSILVFNTNNILEGWDGSYMNESVKLLPPGSYELILDVQDLYGSQKTFSKKINLIR